MTTAEPTAYQTIARLGDELRALRATVSRVALYPVQGEDGGVQGCAWCGVTWQATRPVHRPSCVAGVLARALVMK